MSGELTSDFLRADALEKPLKHVVICEQSYAIFVPQRLVPTRGMLTISAALLNCPHAAIGGDGQLLKQLGELAGKLGGVFIPELVCDSIGQCVAAVETGVFAAVLPVQVRPSSSGKDYFVVEDDSLDTLKTTNCFGVASPDSRCGGARSVENSADSRGRSKAAGCTV